MNYNSDALPNVLRLKGLKNARGRSVMPDPNVLLEEEEPVDYSGTAQPLPKFNNFKPEPAANEPEPELGGELTPQSYDVRANVVESPEEKNMWRRFSDYISPQSLPLPEGTSPIFTGGSPLQNETQIEGKSSNIQTQNQVASNDQNIPRVSIEAPENPLQQIVDQSNPATSGGTINDKKEPGTYVEPGSVQQIYQDANTSPELKSEIERIFQTQLTPERIKETEEFEKVTQAYLDKLNGVDTSLSAYENKLLSKIENRDLSTSEQISMALALLAPALVGGLLGGKEGLLGGLAGGGKALADVLGNRQKVIKEAEESLPEIALERSKISKEKLITTQQANELKRKIKESVPNSALKQLFNRDGQLLNGKLVLNTGNPLIPLKSTAIRSEEDVKHFKEKVLPVLSPKVASTEQGVQLLDTLQSLVNAAKGQQTGFTIWDTPSAAFKAFIPSSRDYVKDENGNEVKISELFETTLEQLSDMYSQSVANVGAKGAFKTYREHFLSMIPNPFTALSFGKGQSNLDTTTSQINSVKNKFEDNIISQLNAVGVETSPIKQLFSKSQINKNQSETKRKSARADEAVKQTLGR
jgi:hypothetical protein